jgi:alpha-ketoglutarate-dependent taurine dioxygenase
LILSDWHAKAGNNSHQHKLEQDEIMAWLTPQLMTDLPIPQILHQPITNNRAWRQAHLAPTDWLVPFPEAGIAELDAIVEMIDRHPQPIHHLPLARIPHLPTCHQVMTRVRKTLAQTGMAIIDRLPVERYDIAHNKTIYCLLGQMLGRVVDQKWDGTTFYDVKDVGKALGHGVRRSITNLDQPFHTDGPWLSITPEIVGLLCLQTAERGGMSRLVSLLTAHTEMRQRHPDLIERLYHPFVWDRQAEHGPGDVPYSIHPVFAYDGKRLSARYYVDYIYKGYALAGAVLDAQGVEALDALQTIVNDADHWVEFRLAQGQLQYLNNHQLAHARTSFTDNQEAAMQRHLLRCWYRNDGLPTLEGHPV